MSLFDTYYDKPLLGISVFSMEQVLIIGEKEIEVDGKQLEQYLYHIIGRPAANGKPFAALKANIKIVS